MEKNYNNSKVVKAALTSSILEVLYTHPIDVIKTHQQNSFKFKFDKHLFRGISARALGIIPIRTSFWTGLHLSNKLEIKDLLNKSLFVSLLQTSIDTPIENIKIRQIYKISYTPLYRGFIPHYIRNSIFLYSFISANNYTENKLLAGFSGGLIGSVLSHPFDYYKTLIQSNTDINKNNFYKVYKGVSARSLICCLSMGVGNWSYNYLLENFFE